MVEAHIEEYRKRLHEPVMRRSAGVKGDICELCGVSFDPGDAKVWTRETGSCHFYPCYLDFTGKQKEKREWEKLMNK